MKIMTCPLNGPRNIQEFQCGGPVKAMPGAEDSDTAWADYVFLDDNPRGFVREWWCHLPSSTWFIAERDTATDAILKTYPASEIFSPEKTAGASQ